MPDIKKSKFNWITLGYVAIIVAIVLPWFLSSGFLFFTDFIWGPHLDIDWTSTPLIKSIVLWVLGLVVPVTVL
ncbi:MAG: hypothetical protein V1738_05935, partial [Patescibacteria group bacterium]